MVVSDCLEASITCCFFQSWDTQEQFQQTDYGTYDYGAYGNYNYGNYGMATDATANMANMTMPQVDSRQIDLSSLLRGVFFSRWFSQEGPIVCFSGNQFLDIL